MNTKEMITVISNRFNSVQDQFRLLLIGFDVEAIHSFRTDIKKLRAFFRLLNMGLSKKKKLCITKKNKIFYWYAGEIRNLQLHQQSINTYLGPEDDPPVRYFSKVKKQVESLQGAVKTLSPGILKTGKIYLPSKNRKMLVRDFLKQQVIEFNKLIVQPSTDEIIHRIRKLLKDILYNWKYCKHYKKMLPGCISEKAKLVFLTELIGDFCDKATGINLLETFLISAEEEENESLIKILHRWQEEKE